MYVLGVTCYLTTTAAAVLCQQKLMLKNSVDNLRTFTQLSLAQNTDVAASSSDQVHLEGGNYIFSALFRRLTAQPALIKNSISAF